MKSKYIIPDSATLRDALAALNLLSGGAMTLFVTDTDNHVIGSLTDGDIRRALIAGAELDNTVESIAFKSFLALSESADRFAIFAEARRRKLQLLPRLDESGALIEIIDLNQTKTALPMEAVLMAGGKGERLRPLTLDCPKPLLKVGEKAIIDYNVEELISVGVPKIYVTVNYLRNQIEEHFLKSEFNNRVECIAEPRRLGTIGSLSLIPSFKEPELLVMNSDLLTTLDFEALYLTHCEQGNDLTMAVIPYTVSIPFSIVRSQGERVTGLTEKPTFNYFAGAGVYLMKSDLAGRIPKGEYMDAPDFIQSLIQDGYKVGQFPIVGRWIDIGSPDDYRYACEIMRNR